MAIGVLTATLTSPGTASAATVTVNFSITSTQASSECHAIGGMGQGSFSCDEALMPACSTGQVGNLVMGLSAGQPYLVRR